MTQASKRCFWCGDDPLYIAYHDQEWGVPQPDGVKLFEKLCLEGFQAGLSWITILRKRENFRNAFDDFNPLIVSKYDEKDIERLVKDEGIIRHRGKIEAVINNAKAFLDIEKEKGDFAKFIWSYVNETPIQNQIKEKSDIEASTEISTALSKELKRQGFKFVGPTTVYAFMQSVGMVNDHFVDCPSYDVCQKLGAAFKL